MFGIVISNLPRPVSTSSSGAARGFVLTPKIAIDERSKSRATRRTMILVAKTVKTMSGDRGDWVARPADRTASRPAERTPKWRQQRGVRSKNVGIAFCRLGASWLGPRRRRSSQSLPGRVGGHPLASPARKGQARSNRRPRPRPSAATFCRRFLPSVLPAPILRVRPRAIGGRPTSGVARRRGPARGSPAGPAVAQNSRHDRAPRNWELARS